MRVILAACRVRGVPFARAWTKAIRSLEPDDVDRDWRVALAWAHPAFAAAYARTECPALRPLGDGSTRGERAVALVVMEGMSHAQAARKVGLSRARVGQLMREQAQAA